MNPVAVATARGNRHAIVANSGSDDLSVLAIGRDGQPPGFKKLVVVDGTGPPDLIALVAEFQGGLLRSIVYRAQ